MQPLHTGVFKDWSNKHVVYTVERLSLLCVNLNFLRWHFYSYCFVFYWHIQCKPAQNLREKVNYDHVYILKKFGMFFKMPLWYKYIMFVLNRIYQVIPSHLLAQFSSFQIIIKIHFDVANIEIWILMHWIVSSA